MPDLMTKSEGKHEIDFNDGRGMLICVQDCKSGLRACKIMDV